MAHPVARRTATRSLVRRISQVALTSGGAATQDTFHTVVREALKWLDNRSGKQLPQDAWAGSSFRLSKVGAQRVEAVSLAEPRLWVARCDDADKTVAQRSWTTEIGVGLMPNGRLAVACRLTCVTLGQDAPYTPSIPGVVVQFARATPLFADMRAVDLKPWHVDRDELPRFLALLRSRARRNPLIVLSSFLADEDPTFDRESLGDALARQLPGAASVVLLSSAAAFELTNRFGKEFSVFGGAVRTYRTGFDADHDDPGRHPLILPGSVASWDGGLDSFREFMVRRTLGESLRGGHVEEELPSFDWVQERALDLRVREAKRVGQSDRQLLEMVEEDNRQLRAKQDELRGTYDGLLQAADVEEKRLVAQFDEARAQFYSLRSRIKHLEDALAAQPARQATPLPDDFDELESWAQRHLSGDVLLTNRALRAARRSEFENVSLAYECLLLMRDHYVPMRRLGGSERRQGYEQALAALGLEESATFAGARAGQYGDEYFIQHGGRRRELDRHIKGSNARDPRFGFRLYFFWDDQMQQVIVGSLPSHLTNDAS